jgi:hypothetical protein
VRSENWGIACGKGESGERGIHPSTPKTQRQGQKMKKILAANPNKHFSTKSSFFYKFLDFPACWSETGLITSFGRYAWRA